jgi:hypothetical protein
MIRIAVVDAGDYRRFRYLGTRRLKRVWINYGKEGKKDFKKNIKKVKTFGRFMTDRGGHFFVLGSFVNLTKKEVMTIITSNKVHYRFPLKLITSNFWANLSSRAKAILPVLGVFANKKGIASPGMDLIAEYSGYKSKDNAEISAGLKELDLKGLMKIKKSGRHYIYYLQDIARWHRGTSFFPIFKLGMILNHAWANLNPSEKALYPVLGVKAKINAARAIDSGCFAVGDVSKIKKYCKWAGISRRSFYRAYEGLIKKDFMIEDFDRKYVYGIFVENSQYVYEIVKEIRRYPTDIF